MGKLSATELSAYLNRIGYTGDATPSKETLNTLIYLHQCAVPFETLDSHDFHIEADLNQDALFDKIVTRRRGGYCLELNGLFYILLRTIGFDVRPCMCRVLLGTDEFTHPVDHRTNLVTLNGRTFFCDVGLGGPMPPAALDIMTDDWQEMRGEFFRVEKDVPGWYAVSRKTAADIYQDNIPDETSDRENLPENKRHHSRIEVLFSDVTCYETDFLFLNHYMSTHPDALHVTHRILNRRTPNGYRAIMDDVYKESADGKITVCSVTDCLEKILAEKFDIHVSL
ncbi:MAG: arylamine N-acetyltransferase [Eubacterium sp.]|jgi:Arylamine N-acetyltransferase|nr:arylamine N-acetyltransferase [Eubacterium sp.]